VVTALALLVTAGNDRSGAAVIEQTVGTSAVTLSVVVAGLDAQAPCAIITPAVAVAARRIRFMFVFLCLARE
jgi:hypothetical protein